MTTMKKNKRKKKTKKKKKWKKRKKKMKKKKKMTVDAKVWDRLFSWGLQHGRSLLSRGQTECRSFQRTSTIRQKNADARAPKARGHRRLSSRKFVFSHTGFYRISKWPYGSNDPGTVEISGLSFTRAEIYAKMWARFSQAILGWRIFGKTIQNTLVLIPSGTQRPNKLCQILKA